jgi:hypothetical protein
MPRRAGPPQRKPPGSAHGEPRVTAVPVSTAELFGDATVEPVMSIATGPEAAAAVVAAT